MAAPAVLLSIFLLFLLFVFDPHYGKAFYYCFTFLKEPFIIFVVSIGLLGFVLFFLENWGLSSIALCYMKLKMVMYV